LIAIVIGLPGWYHPNLNEAVEKKLYEIIIEKIVEALHANKTPIPSELLQYCLPDELLEYSDGKYKVKNLSLISVTGLTF
jgi:hypothetical protein